MRQPRALLASVVTAALAVTGVAASAAPDAGDSPGGFAPVDQKGPALSVPAADLDASLACNGPLKGATRDPILLVPGTTMTPEVNFSWNYQRAFDRLGWRWCAVTLPQDATGDIQVAGEYVVHAVRTMGKASGRKVDVVGYSQGGMVPRWALRFWPDTRSLVDDLVGLAPSNHGTVVADLACRDTCEPANWQQRSTAAFMDALNSGAETFAGVSYTVAYTHTDEIVVPNVGPGASSTLTTGDGSIANIALQDVCPANTADHFAIGSYDPVGYAVTIDALTHPGPALRERIAPTVCLQAVQPGVDLPTFAADYAAYVGYATNSEGNAPEVPAEPALASYVFPRR